MFLDGGGNSTFWSNQTLVLASSFLSPVMVDKWQRCCLDAIDCCLNYLREPFPSNTMTSSATIPWVIESDQEVSEFCPRTWDGWGCWANDVPKGTTVEKQCPDHIYWQITVPPCRGSATKTCTSTGSWFKLKGREWTNYINCARDDVSSIIHLVLTYILIS